MSSRSQLALIFTAVTTLAGSNACAGISFGDDDESGAVAPFCTQHDQAVADLTEIPTGFSEAPATTLAPAEGPYSGTLTLASGEPVPIQMSLTLNGQSVRARYWDVGTAGTCPPPVLTANVDLIINGGTTLSGVAAGGVTTEGGGLSISASVGAEATVTSTLMPSFSQRPLGAPDLLTQMSYLDGAWSGQWQWFAAVDCSGAEMCTGLETVLLGNVLMERN